MESSKSLGQCDFVNVQVKENIEITVANMYAQTGIRSISTGSRSKVNKKPIRYEHLVNRMVSVRNSLEADTIVAPKFGSLRAGGNWSFVEELFDVVICEYP